MPFKYTTKMLFMQAKLKRKHMLRMYFTYILNKEPKTIYPVTGTPLVLAVSVPPSGQIRNFHLLETYTERHKK